MSSLTISSTHYMKILTESSKNHMLKLLTLTTEKMKSSPKNIGMPLLLETNLLLLIWCMDSSNQDLLALNAKRSQLVSIRFWVFKYQFRSQELHLLKPIHILLSLQMNLRSESTQLRWETERALNRSFLNTESLQIKKRQIRIILWKSIEAVKLKVKD